MDPTLEEAARVAGSNWVTTTLRITLPLVSPAIFSALILAFVLGIEDLGAPVVLGYPYGIQTISTLMFDGIDQYPPDHNFGAALGVLLMSITIFGVIIQRRIIGSRAFTTVTGRGYRPPSVDLGWGRYVALAVNLLYLTLAVLLPIATLLVVSFSKAWLGNINLVDFTAHWYQFIFTQNPLALRGIKNSLILATVGATVGICIATIISYAIHRTHSKLRGWLDFITTVPIAVSGMVMSIGLLVALIRTPLYGTLSILLLAYVIRFFTYGQRSVSGIIVALSKDLEESSRVCGASWLTTTRRILLPLVWPGFVGGWLLLFITYMREVSMSLMLSRSGTETLSVALFELLSYAPYGAMAAFTMVQVVVVFFAAIIFIRFTRSEGITI
jgi:iron(III) transport system permease protein